MSKELREIIYINEKEVQHLVNEYKNIENEVLTKLNIVGKELNKLKPIVDENIVISKNGPFNWEGSRVYKYSISKGNNKIWIQFVKEEIHLYSNYYLQEGTDLIFNEILSDLGINKHKRIDYKQSESDLKNIFLNQVKIANESFREYDRRTETE